MPENAADFTEGRQVLRGGRPQQANTGRGGALYRWAALLSLLNLLLLGYMALHRSFTLTGVLYYGSDPGGLFYTLANGLFYRLADRVTVPQSGAATAALLLVFSLLACRSAVARALALLLSAWSVLVGVYLVSFQAHVLQSLCLFCLISSSLFAITFVLLLVALFTGRRRGWIS